MKTIFLITLLALPAAADWERRVLTPKSWRVDVPQPHSLSYFTQYPVLRDESGDLLCYSCPPGERLALAKKWKVRTEVRLVGTLRAFAIYDVFYFFDDNEAPDWKSILVRTSPSQYREIWHYQKNEGNIWPSFLVKVGSETLLGLEDDCYRQDIVQEYYWFGSDSPVRLDLTPIWDAAATALPKDSKGWKGYDGRVDLPAGRFRVGVITRPYWRCCGPGVVDVEFSLKNGKLLPSKATFNQEAQFAWGDCR